MEFSAPAIILSIIFGIIGTGYFIYGRKQSKMVPLLVGIALGVYPYFVSNIVMMLLIGLCLIFLPILFRD